MGLLRSVPGESIAQTIANVLNADLMIRRSFTQDVDQALTPPAWPKSQRPIEVEQNPSHALIIAAGPKSEGIPRLACGGTLDLHDADFALAISRCLPRTPKTVSPAEARRDAPSTHGPSMVRCRQE